MKTKREMIDERVGGLTADESYLAGLLSAEGQTVDEIIETIKEDRAFMAMAFGEYEPDA